MPICALSPHQEIKGADPCQILSQAGSLEIAVHKDRSGRGSCTPTSPGPADITEAGHLPLGTPRTGQGRGRRVRSWNQVEPKGPEIQVPSGGRQAGKWRVAGAGGTVAQNSRPIGRRGGHSAPASTAVWEVVCVAAGASDVSKEVGNLAFDVKLHNLKHLG